MEGLLNGDRREQTSLKQARTDFVVALTRSVLDETSAEKVEKSCCEAGSARVGLVTMSRGDSWDFGGKKDWPVSLRWIFRK